MLFARRQYSVAQDHPRGDRRYLRQCRSSRSSRLPAETALFPEPLSLPGGIRDWLARMPRESRASFAGNGPAADWESRRGWAAPSNGRSPTGSASPHSATQSVGSWRSTAQYRGLPPDGAPGCRVPASKVLTLPFACVRRVLKPTDSRTDARHVGCEPLAAACCPLPQPVIFVILNGASFWGSMPNWTMVSTTRCSCVGATDSG
jgi:hypothetical protein